MRVLGVDFGRSRIGVAVGDVEFRITGARPLLTPSGKLSTDAETIARIATSEACDAIVVGVPYRADGRPGELAKICFQLVELLRKLGCTVHTVNEAGTTVDAERALHEAGVRRRDIKRRRDSEAARQILERFFDGLSST